MEALTFPDASMFSNDDGEAGAHSARCMRLDDSTHVCGISLGAFSGEHDASPVTTSFHFVLDNSGSMGHLTQDARACFSELVAAATGPCSLVVFANKATLMGRAFTTPAQMRAGALPQQGQTNITAGLELTLDTILDAEARLSSSFSSGKQAHTRCARAHHVLVLLSDGAHNVGPEPEASAPAMAASLKAACPGVQLSVVVVGVSARSNTAMGMALKTHLETVPLPALQPIYFAPTPGEMAVALTEVREGIEASRGSVFKVTPVWGAPCDDAGAPRLPRQPRDDSGAHAGTSEAATTAAVAAAAAAAAEAKFTLEAKLVGVEASKRAAVEAEDYVLASELKQKAEGLREAIAAVAAAAKAEAAEVAAAIAAVAALTEPADSPPVVLVHNPFNDRADVGRAVVTSALCFIPDQDPGAWTAIEALRSLHDKQVARWPPHVNLLYPFVPAAAFDEAARVLEAALSDCAPFEVAFEAQLGHFADGPKAFTAFLQPAGASRLALRDLQARCLACFPALTDLNAKSSPGGFDPHLTVGQFDAKAKLDAFLSASGSEAWKPVTVTCSRVVLMSRAGKDAPFFVHRAVRLGGRRALVPLLAGGRKHLFLGLEVPSAAAKFFNLDQAADEAAPAMSAAAAAAKSGAAAVPFPAPGTLGALVEAGVLTAIGSRPEPTATLFAAHGGPAAAAQEVPFVVVGPKPPWALDLTSPDGTTRRVVFDQAMGEGFDAGLAAAALSTLLERARVAKVVQCARAARSGGGGRETTAGLRQLSAFIDSFEARSTEAHQRAAAAAGTSGGVSGGGGLQLGHATPFSRLAQHKAAKSAMTGLRELRNDLAAIEAHASTDSSAQAAFLNGSTSKFAAKALKRAKVRFAGAAAVASAAAASTGNGVGSATDARGFEAALSADLTAVGAKMRGALRADVCRRVCLATRTGGFLARAANKAAGSGGGAWERAVAGSPLSAEVTVDGAAAKRLGERLVSLGGVARERSASRASKGHKDSSPDAAARAALAAFLVAQAQSGPSSEGLTADALLAFVTSVTAAANAEANAEAVAVAAAVEALVDGGELDACIHAFLESELSVSDSSGGGGGGSERGRESYLSLLTAKEQLVEWAEAGSSAIGTACGGEGRGEGGSEYDALMFLGALAFPLDMERRAATQMDPYAMKVTRVRTSVVDTASLCCALKSGHPVVPPEGGLAVSDALVVKDPDSPFASALAASSVLLGEVWTSVSLCRDLHMYTGRAMRVALHAHALAAACPALPAASSPKDSKASRGTLSAAAKALARKDLEASLRRSFLGRAFQCGACSFGPIDHFACRDLESHHGEASGGHAKVDNSCPRCGWFTPLLDDWAKWDGTVPDETEGGAPCAIKSPDRADPYGCRAPSRASVEAALRVAYSARWVLGTRQAVELAGLVASWDAGLVTCSAGGPDHPLQAALALVCLCDDDDALNGHASSAPEEIDGSENVAGGDLCDPAVGEAIGAAMCGVHTNHGARAAPVTGVGDLPAALATPALLALCNEACARAAKDHLRMHGGNKAAATNAGAAAPMCVDLTATGRSVAAAFLGVDLLGSAPEAKAADEPEPPESVVREACSAHVKLFADHGGGDDFDVEGFVMGACAGVLALSALAVELRHALKARGGGWARLAQDMEAGHPGCYADVVDHLIGGSSALALGTAAQLDGLLNLIQPPAEAKAETKAEAKAEAKARAKSAPVAASERNPFGPALARRAEAQAEASAERSAAKKGDGEVFLGRRRMLATVAAQAFLHPTSTLRRTVAQGGSLPCCLGDVRDGETLRALAVDLRMATYRERVAAKMATWKRVGSDVVVARARAADIGQYMSLMGGCTHAHALDKPTFWGLWRAAKADGHNGGKVAFFLGQANQPFRAKHGTGASFNHGRPTKARQRQNNDDTDA